MLNWKSIFDSLNKIEDHVNEKESMMTVFKNKETGEEIFIDSDDFESWKKLMSSNEWTLVLR